MRLLMGGLVFCVLVAPLRVAAQGMGWDGRPVQPLPPAQGAPYGYAPGYGMNPQAMFLYEEQKRSPGLALLLSLFLPGLGSIYADHWAGAAITWGLIIGGFSIAIWGIKHLDEMGSDAGAAVFIGWFVASCGILYNPFDAYTSARDFNHELAQRLGLPVVGVTPIRTSNGDMAWGPALQLRF